MSRFIAVGVTLGALSTGLFASATPAHAAVTLDPAMTAACWKQVRQPQHWPGYGTDGGADRRREFLFDACIQNRGRIPGE